MDAEEQAANNDLRAEPVQRHRSNTNGGKCMTLTQKMINLGTFGNQ
jgi:hypothetical protein